ncbi:cytochrome c maturation protein CcmE [Pseudomarimonas arenosa]|uniref:Cytochrome c-type biogenesis protein CcmE n=1 Tax=Pseudomarimonas arenosa TaxID=2774145 RepID=A0AAW3ZLN5_9GAMM|nr:cytochrome c maturation protein CcmE [Pseudomarimonas arenosa]MBD8525326.1 cytochrome c maturation protein CcmE [Pseudomarimonas arenosa]
MNSVKKQRMLVAILVVIAASVAVTFVTFALQSNMTYLYSPSEVHEGQVPSGSAFRIGGVVKEASVKRQAGSLDVEFQVTDRIRDYPVRYSGILPDLFREGQTVIARGEIDNGVFVAKEVLAKHDETYMPPEVAEKIAEAHAKAAQVKQATPTTAEQTAVEPAAQTEGEGP